MALNQYTSPSPKPGLIMIAMIMLDDAKLNILRYSYITKGVMSSRAGTACQVSSVKCQVARAQGRSQNIGNRMVC